MDDKIDIALPADQGLQRFLVRRVFRDAEFTFHLHDSLVYHGYITAIDEEGIQISTAEENPRAVFLYHHAILAFEESPERITRFPLETQENIRKWSRALRSQCEFILTGRTRPKQIPHPKF